MAILVEREEAVQELTRTRSALTAANEKLDAELRTRCEQLYQERYISNKFELGEQAMQATAQDLKSLLKASAADLDAVFAKTDRLKFVLAQNSATTTNTVGSIDQLLNKNLSAVCRIQSTASRLVDQIRERSVAQLGENISALGGQRTELEAGLASVAKELQGLAEDLVKSSRETKDGLKQLVDEQRKSQQMLQTHLAEESQAAKAAMKTLEAAGLVMAEQVRWATPCERLSFADVAAALNGQPRVSPSCRAIGRRCSRANSSPSYADERGRQDVSGQGRWRGGSTEIVVRQP